MHSAVRLEQARVACRGPYPVGTHGIRSGVLALLAQLVCEQAPGTGLGGLQFDCAAQRGNGLLGAPGGGASPAEFVVNEGPVQLRPGERPECLDGASRIPGESPRDAEQQRRARVAGHAGEYPGGLLSGQRGVGDEQPPDLLECGLLCLVGVRGASHDALIVCESRAPIRSEVRRWGSAAMP